MKGEIDGRDYRIFGRPLIQILISFAYECFFFHVALLFFFFFPASCFASLQGKEIVACYSSILIICPLLCSAHAMLLGKEH